MMPDIEYSVHIDWDNDGDFDDPEEDVSGPAQRPIQIQYGRDQARSLAPPAPGRADLTLDNRAGDYSPENPASPIAGNLKPNRPVRIQAIHDATTYDLYRGHLDEYNVTPALGLPMAAFTALDGLAGFRGVDISTEVHHGITTGQAIGYILDAVGWPALERDLDVGVTTIRWWWEEGRDAFTALDRVLNSEGPPALLTVAADGKIVFRDRHHRLTRAESLTSQATFSASGGPEPVMARPLGYDVGWRDIANVVTMSVEDRVPTPDPVVVFETEQLYTVGSGSEISISVETNDPFIRAVVPVAGADFVLQAGTVEVSLSRTSGTETSIIVRAIGGTATVAGMKLRAYSLPVASTFQIHQEDATSIGDYGRRSYPHDAPWAGVHDALALAQVILAHRAERRPVVSMRIQGANDERLTQALGRDLSDRIRITEPSLSLDADFHIEQIRHTIQGDDKLHETVFGCEKAPVPVANPFTFGVAGRGFDEGQFGQAGFSNPSTMFRFDVTGQGFNDGLFAF